MADTGASIRVVPFKSVGLLEFGMSLGRAERAERDTLGSLRGQCFPALWASYSREGSLAAVGTCNSFLLDVEGWGRLVMSFERVAERFSSPGRDCLVRPRSVCSFDAGLTFELHSGDNPSTCGYIATVCSADSLQLLRWRIYGVVAHSGGSDREMAEPDDWTNNDEWSIALETAVSMLEERRASVSEGDVALMRRLGLMMGMDAEFFAWLDEVPGEGTSPPRVPV